MASTITKPFLPSDRVRPPAGASLVRAVTAELLRYARRGIPATIDEVLDMFPSEQRREIELLTRADASPATTIGSGWVDTFTQTAVTDFLVNLGPSSAASTLLQRGMRLKFDGTAGKIVVPDIVCDADSATFVGEGKPIPVRNLSFGSGKTLAPRAFKTIAVFSREALAYSNAETQIRAAVTEKVGLALDKVVFSTNAEVANVSPAGLLLDLVGLTPSHYAAERSFDR